MLKIICFFIFLSLSGCGSLVKTIKYDDQVVEIKEIYPPYPSRGNYYTGFYSLLQKVDGKWTVVELSGSPINRTNSYQEVVYFNFDKNYFSPVFNSGVYFRDQKYPDIIKGYRCRVRPIKGDVEGVYRDGGAYPFTPCESRFMGNIGDINRSLDGKLFSAAIIESKLYEQIKKRMNINIGNYDEDVKNKTLASEFEKNVKVTTKIINKSGFSVPENIVQESKVVKYGSSYPLKLSDVRCEVSFSVDNKFQLENERPLWLDYNSSGYNIVHELIVKRVLFDEIKPNVVLKNGDIAIEIDKIVARGGDIQVSSIIKNNTNKYVKVETVSFYVNGVILSLKYENLKLPPYSVEGINGTFENSKNSKFMPAYKSIANYFSREEANSIFLKIGASVEYSVEEKGKTLYEETEQSYLSMLRK